MNEEGGTEGFMVYVLMSPAVEAVVIMSFSYCKIQRRKRGAFFRCLNFEMLLKRRRKCEIAF